MASWKSQSQDPRGLVEGFSRRVVPCSTYQRKPAVAFHECEVRVPPGGDEAHQRKPRLALGVQVLQPRGVYVSLEVIQAYEGQLIGQGETFGRVDANEKRARKTGPVSHRHAVQVSGKNPCLLKGLLQDWNDRDHVLARRHLRHDTPVFGVHLRLRGDHVGQYGASVLDDRRGGLVARSLYAQYFHAFHITIRDRP